MNEFWNTLVFHLEHGNFTALQASLGGYDEFDRFVIDSHKRGYFDDRPEILNEALTCAFMLGQAQTVRYLLDVGVDAYAGIATGLAGPHYAASSGRLDMIEIVIANQVSLEVENTYGGTVLGQALWSALNETKPDHAEIIEKLVDAGAVIQDGVIDWWDAQDDIPVALKTRVANALRSHSTN